MSADFDKDFVPIWCEGCNKQGQVFADDLERPYFVVCPRCGRETSTVWCPKCQVGGEFVTGIEERPMSWVCSSCHTEYTLPVSFYEQPLLLYQENNLLDEVRARVRSSGHNRHSKGANLIALTAFIGIALVFVSLFAHKWGVAALFFALMLVIMVVIGRWMTPKTISGRRS